MSRREGAVLGLEFLLSVVLRNLYVVGMAVATRAARCSPRVLACMFRGAAGCVPAGIPAGVEWPPLPCRTAVASQSRPCVFWVKGPGPPALFVYVAANSRPSARSRRTHERPAAPARAAAAMAGRSLPPRRHYDRVNGT